jgi:MYXO-CTERM domain-containing protein
MRGTRVISWGFGLLLSLGAVSSARADVPAGYKGTPYMGKPWPLPGRIDFENYDDGGMGVGWRVDDHTGNFGVGGCPGNSYRATLPHPQLCETNTNPGEIDLYSAGAKKGTKYPSDAMPQSIYIGYAHGVDWVKLTVNVAKAGMYKLSSTWGSEPGGAGGIHFQILMNDVMKADVMLTGTGGYHNWVDFPDFATVQLDAGVQVLQFAVKSNHVNYDYLQFSLVNADGSVDPGNSMGSPGGGAAGASGGAAGASGGAAGASGNAGASGAAGASGGAAGASGNAGASGAAGASGTAGTSGGAAGNAGDPGAAGSGVAGDAGGTAGASSPGGSAGESGAAGAAGASSAAGAPGTGTAGTSGSSSGGGAGVSGHRASSSSGCSYAAPAEPRPTTPTGVVGFLLLTLAAVRRRRAR